jgi:co-chaperonin GroES (HSP10)
MISALPPGKPKFEKSTIGRGLQAGGETLTVVPAECPIRPLRDQIIVEPLDVVYSRYLIVHSDTKPMRGIVKAVGPGHYPKIYDHPDKHKRTKMRDSSVFRPTEIKVGDIVQLGGMEIGGYKFEQFLWGDRAHVICREADVCGIES